MLHIWMSHVAHMNESCHTYEWVMSHIWMSHAAHMNESCHTYEWVMPHIWLSHVTHMTESCRTYEWVMSHVWMSHVTHMNESCHTYETCNGCIESTSCCSISFASSKIEILSAMSWRHSPASARRVCVSRRLVQRQSKVRGLNCKVLCVDYTILFWLGASVCDKV